MTPEALARLNAHRRANGEFGNQHHSEPEPAPFATHRQRFEQQADTYKESADRLERAARELVAGGVRGLVPDAREIVIAPDDARPDDEQALIVADVVDADGRSVMPADPRLRSDIEQFVPPLAWEASRGEFWDDWRRTEWRIDATRPRRVPAREWVDLVDEARAEAHATVGVLRTDIADRARELGLDIDRVDIADAATAQERGIDEGTIAAVIDADGRELYAADRPGDFDPRVQDLVDHADALLRELRERTDDDGLRRLAKLADEANRFGVDDTGGRPAVCRDGLRRLRMWETAADPTAVALL